MTKSKIYQDEIITAEHNADNPYLMINRASIEDANLSLRAKGLLAFIMTKAYFFKLNGRNFNISCRGMAAILPESKDIIARTLKELIGAGYAVRTRSNPGNGQQPVYTYRVFETLEAIKKWEENVKERMSHR